VPCWRCVVGAARGCSLARGAGRGLFSQVPVQHGRSRRARRFVVAQLVLEEAETQCLVRCRSWIGYRRRPRPCCTRSRGCNRQGFVHKPSAAGRPPRQPGRQAGLRPRGTGVGVGSGGQCCSHGPLGAQTGRTAAASVVQPPPPRLPCRRVSEQCEGSHVQKTTDCPAGSIATSRTGAQLPQRVPEFRVRQSRALRLGRAPTVRTALYGACEAVGGCTPMELRCGQVGGTSGAVRAALARLHRRPCPRGRDCSAGWRRLGCDMACGNKKPWLHLDSSASGEVCAMRSRPAEAQALRRRLLKDANCATDETAAIALCGRAAGTCEKSPRPAPRARTARRRGLRLRRTLQCKARCMQGGARRWGTARRRDLRAPPLRACCPGTCVTPAGCMRPRVAAGRVCEGCGTGPMSCVRAAGRRPLRKGQMCEPVVCGMCPCPRSARQLPKSCKSDSECGLGMVCEQGHRCQDSEELRACSRLEPVLAGETCNTGQACLTARARRLRGRLDCTGPPTARGADVLRQPPAARCARFVPPHASRRSASRHGSPQRCQSRRLRSCCTCPLFPTRSCTRATRPKKTNRAARPPAPPRPSSPGTCQGLERARCGRPAPRRPLPVPSTARIRARCATRSSSSVHIPAPAWDYDCRGSTDTQCARGPPSGRARTKKCV